MMVGYHLTSEENWEKIRRQGLIPYRNPNFQPPLPACGIFLWREIPRGPDLGGCVIDRVAKLQSMRIVLLAVRHRADEMLYECCPACLANGIPSSKVLGTCTCRMDIDQYRLVHVGSLARTNLRDPTVRYYHRARPFRVLTVKIPPRRITRIAVFDLARMMTRQLHPEDRAVATDMGDWDAWRASQTGVHPVPDVRSLLCRLGFHRYAKPGAQYDEQDPPFRRFRELCCTRPECTASVWHNVLGGARVYIRVGDCFVRIE